MTTEVVQGKKDNKKEAVKVKKKDQKETILTSRKAALKIIKGKMPESRYIHTLGVMETAIHLAEKYGEDVKKAEIAAIFHDYAKYCDEDEMRQIIVEQQLPQELLTFYPSLWHGPVGAYLVKTEVGITDEDILNAISYHTTGRTGMSLLEKIIYVADYIEPNRSFSGVKKVRKLAEENLDKALFKAISNTIKHCVHKKWGILPNTFTIYNELALTRRGGKK